METILWIIGGFAAVFGIGALLFSNSRDPKERAKEAGAAAVGGAFVGLNCLLQLILPVLGLLVGLWLLMKIMGK